MKTSLTLVFIFINALKSFLRQNFSNLFYFIFIRRCRKKYNEQDKEDNGNGKKIENNDWINLDSLKLNCLLNLSAAELKQQRYKRCVEICNQVCCMFFLNVLRSYYAKY